MSDYIEAATLLAGIGIGALLISLLWGMVVGFSPRRRREPPAEPELQPERPPAPPAPQRPREPLPPLADTADDGLPAPGWPGTDSDQRRRP